MIWVYCVVQGSDGELRAITRKVPEEEYGEEALKRNLNDLAWLERVAREHEATIERALADGPVVPVSLCTIYRSEEQVDEMLRERADQFRDALKRLAGTAEWGVKVLVDPAALGGDDEVPAPSSGLAYIERKRRQARAKAEAEALVATTVREIHDRVSALAIGSTILPAQNRTLSGHEGEMVMNAAYLVPHERVDELRAAIADVPPAFSVQLTGPWPAYNFAEATA
jgi:hypothetical protein